MIDAIANGLMAKFATARRVENSPAACMRRKRETLYASGFQQCKVNVPESFGDRLKELKSQYNMRGLENVVSAMIRKAMANFAPEDLLTPPPPVDYDKTRQVAIHIPREQYAYLEAVAHRNRGVTLGVALETVGAYVTDLTPPPVQLSLIEGDAP